MVNYDPQALYELAAKLQNGTKRLVTVFTLMGAMMGAAIGAIVHLSMQSGAYWVVALWTVLLAVFGFVAGRERAFTMKLKAQQALCQLRMEENTRPQQASAAAGGR